MVLKPVWVIGPFKQAEVTTRNYTYTLRTYTHREIYTGLLTLMGFPDSSVGKESACNAEDPSSIPGSGRSPGEGERLPTTESDMTE